MEDGSYISEMIHRHPQLAHLKDQVLDAASCMIECYRRGGKILICGNGGSCSDAGHIVGELMKGFERRRPLDKNMNAQLLAFGGERGKYLSEYLQKGLPAISLADHGSLITATANDTAADLIFAQQVVGYGKPGDVLIGISTSGNARNVLDAIITARSMGMNVIGLTGETGGKMKDFCDVLISIPGTRTCLIQELMVPVYHTLCLIVEDVFFGDKT
jgi:D-sedoheptulose 7-phosphate isomerase